MTDYALPKDTQPSYGVGEDVVSYQDIKAASLRLREEDVLVRTMAAETVRASGLVVPHTRFHTVGPVFYGVVVAHGPGRVIYPKPTSVWIVKTFAGLPPEPHVAVFANEADARDYHDTCVDGDDPVEVRVQGRREPLHVPPTWKVGDHVVVRSGYGLFVELAEGTHAIVSRGDLVAGHGVMASWTPGHEHCWHYEAPESTGIAHDDVTTEAYACACGERRTPETLDTSYPHCMDCPPGPRVAEYVRGIDVQRFKTAPKISDAERGAFDERGARIGEARPGDVRDDPDVRGV